MPFLREDHLTKLIHKVDGRLRKAHHALVRESEDPQKAGLLILKLYVT